MMLPVWATAGHAETLTGRVVGVFDDGAMISMACEKER
jgi:hypothetical protein